MKPKQETAQRRTPRKQSRADNISRWLDRVEFSGAGITCQLNDGGRLFITAILLHNIYRNHAAMDTSDTSGTRHTTDAFDGYCISNNTRGDA